MFQVQGRRTANYLSLVSGWDGWREREREGDVTYLDLLSAPGPQGLALKMTSLSEFQVIECKGKSLGKNVSEGKYIVHTYVDYIVLEGEGSQDWFGFREEQ